jgi:hypothetical protein
LNRLNVKPACHYCIGFFMAGMPSCLLKARLGSANPAKIDLSASLAAPELYPQKAAPCLTNPNPNP